MAKTKKQKSGIARLLEIAGRRKILLITSGILSVIHVMLSMVPYVVIYYVIDILLNKQTTGADINRYLLWAFIAVASSFVFMYVSGTVSHIAAFNILYELRCKIAAKLGKLPMGYVGNRSSGALKKILADDVERIETFIAHSIPDTVKAVVLPIAMLTYLFIIDWRLALISFIPLVILTFIIPKIMGTKKNRKMMGDWHNSLEAMNAGIVEFVRAMPVMKIFGQSASSFSKYSKTVEHYDNVSQQWLKVSANVWGTIMSYLNNALIPVLALGLYLYFSSGITLSVLFLFLILGVGYVRPLFALTSLSTQLMMINHGVKRMDEILFEVAEQKSGNVASFPSDFSVNFNDVNFSYSEGIDVLRNVNFSVPQGTITALVGPSGSGKSTVAQLIARFYDVKTGSIKLGDTNINEFENDFLMQNIGFVFQDNMMFYQSIYDNILMGMDKTKEEVIAAAKVARCHNFIMKLPNGYDTHFGEEGIHLSGGEQQRIQLARVVLKNAPIIILDEATAFSDPENEHLILEAFNEIIQNKTVIIIAHRLSIIAGVNQIVVLNNGKVEAAGPHNQLLQTCELYNNMWNAHTRAKEFEIINN